MLMIIDDDKLLIMFMGFMGLKSYQSSSIFCIHQCFLYLCFKAYHDLLTICPCDTSTSKIHPQSSMNKIQHCYLTTELIGPC